ncbi:MAG: Thermostable carboxypeptidase 1 [Microgenomates group bacterium GW2011_GWD1_33_9]|nr:MAG: Thermostable carboxypeptidase 1 [Microgenomates group bacterium GW2011_GWD1_33_9]
MTVFKNPTILKILDYYKNLWALSYVSGIAHWDLETYMPTKGITNRGQALGRIATIRQKMFLNKDFVRLVSTANGLQQLTDQERGVVRLLKRSLDFYQKIPSNFLEKFENLTNTATVVWREAKNNNNFKLFEKDLTKIFDMNRQMAEYLGYKDSPYDALLDLFEEGLTSNKVGPFFDEIRKPLKSLLSKIISSGKYQAQDERVRPLQLAKYDKQKMQELNNKILKYLWNDFDRFRLDVSSHPFTTSFGNNDTRITTWYHKSDFARSLLATVHEFGHALYDMQSADEFEMTPIAGGSSLVIHESQSRFWENHIGKSEQFISKFFPDFQKVTGVELQVDEVYNYFNQVKPSLLRVEADEVTYHFHIMLRFEIEKGIIDGKLKVKDLPEIWNSKMKKYLGIVPKKASDGPLQDIHWSGGSVGYFPTYSLGTFLSAQWAEAIKVGPSKLNPYKGPTFLETETKTWFRGHIHKFGSTYTLENLLKKNKMKFDPAVNIKYLQKKYSKIYNF